MEAQLRDMILDLEERIYAGTLGYLRDVENRIFWRMDIIDSTDTLELLNYLRTN